MSCVKDIRLNFSSRVVCAMILTAVSYSQFVLVIYLYGNLSKTDIKKCPEIKAFQASNGIKLSD